METINDDEIKHILNLYKCRREKDKEKYHQRKLDPVFMESNRARARKHYHKVKEVRKETYIQNCELHKAKCSYHYYAKNDNVEKFKVKYPDRYELLDNINYFKDKKPLESETTSSEE